MKKWNVVIHYEGAWDVDVKANTMEEAKEIACDMFANETDVEEIWQSVDWDVIDAWQEN